MCVGEWRVLVLSGERVDPVQLPGLHDQDRHKKTSFDLSNSGMLSRVHWIAGIESLSTQGKTSSKAQGCVGQHGLAIYSPLTSAKLGETWYLEIH